MAFGLWEPYVREFSLKEGDVFVDVGAHIGYHTVYFAKQVGKQGLVIALEPDKRNQMILRRNISRCDKGNIVLCTYAAGFDGYSYVDFTENPLYSKFDRESNGQRTRSISLDTLLLKNGLLLKKEYNSLVIKIDVEGAELDVINGASRLIEHRRPTFIIETDKILQVARIIRRFGYKCRRAFGSYFIIEPSLQKQKWISRLNLSEPASQRAPVKIYPKLAQ